ncbi:MAG: ABC transporter substrate-binding protein [Clostridiales bacterium]|nr:ABC transporter substrate-binding protein [Clostridiales bacterium]
MKKWTKTAAFALSLVILTGCAGQTQETGNTESGTNQTKENIEEQVDFDGDYSQLSSEELQNLFEQEEAFTRTIHIGYDGGLCQAAIPVAYYKGFFEQEGLQVELTAAEDSRDALAAGLIDTSAGMIAQWLTSVQNGVDIRFSVGLHTGCAAMVTLPDGVDKLEKGLKIGVVGAIGGIYHNIGLRMAAHDGFTADDFTWLGFDSGAILLALQNGEVDAIVASEQLTKQWVDEGTVKQIRSLTTDEDFKNEACCVMGISGKFQDANPVASYKIIRAIYKASKWLAESEENRKETAQILVENNYVSCDEEYALTLLNYYQFGLDNDTTEKSLYDSISEYAQLGVISKDTDADAFKEQIWYRYNLENLEK